MKPTLIIMAKAPIMGHAKTRLAAGIGPVHAKRLYRMMMARTIARTRDPRWDTVLAVTPRRSLGRVTDWRGIPQFAQSAGNLTPRLAAVFAAKGPTVVIGTDCPEVHASDIAAAFAAMKSGRAVLGPADDGGFWLIGLNGPARADLFEDVRWSHAQTLVDMEARFERPVVHLRTLIDVDDVAALRAWRRAQSSACKARESQSR